MTRALWFLLACMDLFAVAEHDAAAQQPLTEEEAFQLGVDAYVCGYPLLVMDSIRRVSTNVAAPLDKLARGFREQTVLVADRPEADTRQSPALSRCA